MLNVICWIINIFIIKKLINKKLFLSFKKKKQFIVGKMLNTLNTFCLIFSLTYRQVFFNHLFEVCLVMSDIIAISM